MSESPARPIIVGVGGTGRPGSSSEKALRYVLGAAEARGAATEIFTAADIAFPMYDPEVETRSPEATRFVDAIRRCHGVAISTPGYHGGLSGLLKNALDHVQDLADGPTPYLHNRAVGCIASAYGWQASMTALVSLRSTVHALRAWPTPLGVPIHSGQQRFDDEGQPDDPKLAAQLETMAEQLLAFSSGRVGSAA